MSDDDIQAAERTCAEAMEATGHLRLGRSEGCVGWRFIDPPQRPPRVPGKGIAPPFATDAAALDRLIEWARGKGYTLEVNIEPGRDDMASVHPRVTRSIMDYQYGRAPNWKEAVVRAVAAAVRAPRPGKGET